MRRKSFKRQAAMTAKVMKLRLVHGQWTIRLWEIILNSELILSKISHRSLYLKPSPGSGQDLIGERCALEVR